MFTTLPNFIRISVIGLAVSGLMVSASAQVVTPETFALACQEIQFTKIGGDSDLTNLQKWCVSTPAKMSVIDIANRPTRDLIATMAAAALTRRTAVGSVVRGQQAPTIFAPVLGQGSPAASDLSQAAIILGLTDFLIERTEAELQSWLLPSVYTNVCETGKESLTVVDFFPSTCRLLDGSATLGLSTAAATLHAAVRRDVRAVPVTIVQKALQDSRTPRWAFDALGYVAAVTNLTSPGQAGSVAEIVAGLQGPEMASPIVELATFVEAVLTHSGVARPPRTVDEWTAWLQAAMFNLADAEGANCNMCTQLIGYVARFDEVYKHLASAEQAINAVHQIAEADESGTATAAHRLQAALTFFGHIVSAFQATMADNSPDASRLRNVLVIAGQTVAAVEAGDLSGGLAAAVQLVRVLEIDSVLPAHAIRLLSFAAAIGDARDSDGVKEAIKDFATQAGGQGKKRMKRHGWLVGVQAYGGVTFGAERALTSRADTPTDAFGGLFVSFGLEINPANWPIGLYLQVLDLGTVATGRITKQSAEGLSVSQSAELDFQQVVAPGAFFTLALPRTPLSLGAGISRVPDLRKLDNGFSDAPLIDQVRLSMFVAVDISIFP